MIQSHRSVLPIPDRKPAALPTYEAKDQPLRPPAGAPNVLVILLDDVGLGASSSVYSDVGRELAQVTDEYARRDNGFAGTIKWVQLEAGEDSHDHLIPAEAFVHMAMAKQ